MVAPQDIGRIAAGLLIQTAERTGPHYVEGPKRYTPADVAATFANALAKPINVVTTPRDQWTKSFETIGFSKTAAKSYVGMTALTMDGSFPVLDEVERGSISLQDYVFELAAEERSR